MLKSHSGTNRAAATAAAKHRGQLALVRRELAQANAAVLLDEPQAAVLLQVEPRTLRLWRRTRGLPHHKITSKVIRYRRDDLDAWLARFRTVIG